MTKPNEERDVGQTVVVSLYRPRTRLATPDVSATICQQSKTSPESVLRNATGGASAFRKRRLVSIVPTWFDWLVRNEIEKRWIGLKTPPGAHSFDRLFGGDFVTPEPWSTHFGGTRDSDEIFPEPVAAFLAGLQAYQKPMSRHKLDKKLLFYNFSCVALMKGAVSIPNDEAERFTRVSREHSGSKLRAATLDGVLDLLNAKAVANDGFGDLAGKLAALLEEDPDLAAGLIGTIQRRERHGRVRWLIIEELSKMQSPTPLLTDALIEGIQEWEEKTEALPLLGAAVALNHLSVPEAKHEEIRGALKSRLTGIELRELDQVRTELVCQFLNTYGSYAEAKDLEILTSFWRRGAAAPHTLRDLRRWTPLPA